MLRKLAIDSSGRVGLNGEIIEGSGATEGISLPEAEGETREMKLMKINVSVDCNMSEVPARIREMMAAVSSVDLPEGVDRGSGVSFERNDPDDPASPIGQAVIKFSLQKSRRVDLSPYLDNNSAAVFRTLVIQAFIDDWQGRIAKLDQERAVLDQWCASLNPQVA